MENKEQPATSNDLDLVQVFSKINALLSSVGLNFLHFLAILRKVPFQNKTLFVILISLSFISGVFYNAKKKFYETTMILSSNYLNKRLVGNSIEKLNLLAEEQNKIGLAKVLNIPDSIAKNIIEFSAKPFVEEKDLIELEVLKEQLKNAQAEAKNSKVIDQVIQRIEIENRHAFEITVRTYSPTVIENLQVALVNYFKNNDYIKRRIEVTKSNLLDKKVKLSNDLEKLDSLKFIIYDNYKSMASQSRQGSNNVILSDKAVTDPVQIYNQDLDLYNQLQSVNTQIYLQPDFEIVDGFTEFSDPASASLPKVIAISLLIGIGCSYLFVALINFNRYLAKLS